jgi:sterol desaturase/sphingolipid hydroxylase (fatty acid hydroxylase superfamily)
MTALRVLYPLVMLLGFNGAAVGLVALGAPHWTLAPLLFAAIAASFGVERLIPYERGWNAGRGDTLRDWLHFVVNETSGAAGVLVLPLVASIAPWGDRWPKHWPLALQLLLAVVVFDAGVTLTHWASHRVPFLWRFHAVHHSVKRFYGFNGLMKHPVHQAIETGVGVLPLVLFGLPPAVASLLAFSAGIQLLLQHSNADYTLGAVGRWLALSAGHRFHHLKSASEGDVNFGFFTTVWDRLLGTWSFDPERRFTSDDLGMADAPDYPDGYAAQLAEPFRSRAPTP